MDNAASQKHTPQAQSHALAETLVHWHTVSARSQHVVTRKMTQVYGTKIDFLMVNKTGRECYTKQLK